MDIVLATRNKMKIKETRRITAGMPITILLPDDFPDCPETESSPVFYYCRISKITINIAIFF